MDLLTVALFFRRALFARRPTMLGSLCLLALAAGVGRADPVQGRRPQGWAHGYVSITTLEGQRLGTGDLVQRLQRGVITSHLVLNFSDGSVDDETTVYTQAPNLRLMSDHHIQHGPSFPTPSDVLIDVTHSRVRVKDDGGKITDTALSMPADTYNGMASTVLMNLPHDATESTIAIVIGGAKPRVAHLKSTLAGKKSFTLGATSHEGAEWTVHVELGGVAQVIAPVIGKAPPDYHVLIGGGDDPVFLRVEGPLYEGGPIWRVQQISAAFPE